MRARPARNGGCWEDDGATNPSMDSAHKRRGSTGKEKGHPSYKARESAFCPCNVNINITIVKAKTSGAATIRKRGRIIPIAAADIAAPSVHPTLTSDGE